MLPANIIVFFILVLFFLFLHIHFSHISFPLSTQENTLIWLIHMSSTASEHMLSLYIISTDMCKCLFVCDCCVLVSLKCPNEKVQNISFDLEILKWYAICIFQCMTSMLCCCAVSVLLLFFVFFYSQWIQFNGGIYARANCETTATVINQ